MHPILVKNWWSIALRGLAAIAFGALALTVPRLSLGALMLLFAFYALADGIFNLLGIFMRQAADHRPWWALLVEGVVSIGAGIATLAWPGLTAIVLTIIIGSWAIVTGLFEIGAAIRLRKEIEGEWLLGLLGVLSIAFGVALFVAPGQGALALVMWIGAYALMFGVLLLVLAVRLRSFGARSHGGPLPGH